MKNSIGNLFQVSIFGESHGDCIGSIVIYTQKREKEQLIGLGAITKTAASFLGKQMEQ